jgi:hypothetical protein
MQQDNRRSKRPLQRYRSLVSFYNADPRRLHSREVDIGLWWRESAEGPLHRAAWVRETGELYLVRLGAAEDGGGAVELLAKVSDRERLELALEGWREHCGEVRSLPWLRQRAAHLGLRPRARSTRLPATRKGSPLAARA